MNVEGLWERLRFLILIGLITLSLIQAGILWFSQNQGFSFYFFADNGNDPAFSNKINLDKESYFFPQRIILSPGIGEFKRVLSSNYKDYDKFWDEIKEKYLKRLIYEEIKPSKVTDFDTDEWGSLMSKSPITVELTGSLPVEIVGLFLGDSVNINTFAPKKIEKIIISPNDLENGNQDVLYTTDGINLSKYLLNNQDDDLLTMENVQLIDQEFEEKDNIRYIATFDQLRNEESYDKDIIIEFNSKNSRLFYPVERSLPKIGIRDSYTLEQLDAMSKLLLGEENDNYIIPSENAKEGTAIFRKPGSGVYSVFQNGIFEYKYLSSTRGIKRGGVVSSFEQAIAFIDNINKRADIAKGVKISLSEIKEYPQGEFGFYFKYIVNTGDGAGNYDLNFVNENQNAAIYIRTDAKKITECRWIMGVFVASHEMENLDTNFNDLINETYDVWNLSGKSIHIAKLGFCYIAEIPKAKNEVMKPNLIIRSETKNNYYIELPVK